MSASLDELYERTDDYASYVQGLEFSQQVWTIFAQLEKPASINHVVAKLKLPVATVETAVGRLVQGKVLKKKVAQLSAKPESGNLAKPAPVPSRAVQITNPTIPSASDGSLGTNGENPTVALRLSPVRSHAGSDTPAIALRIAPVPAQDTSPGAPKWRLKPVLDAISTHAGGGVPGQLAVYKIFLKLPSDLLKEAGLQSVAAVDDKFTFRNPALKQAIIDSARSQANFDVAGLFTDKVST